MGKRSNDTKQKKDRDLMRRLKAEAKRHKRIATVHMVYETINRLDSY